MELEDVLQPKVTIKVEEDEDVELQPKVTVKVEEEEVSDVKGCYIWFSENTQSNLLEETVSQPKKRRCAIVNCSNSFWRKTIHEEPFLSYHKFPKDEKTREIWIKLCKKGNNSNTNNSYVCSKHFKFDDYTKNVAIIQGMPRRYNRLKPGVVPSLNLPEGEVEISPSGSSSLNTIGSIILDRETDVLDEGHDSSHDVKETFTAKVVNSTKDKDRCLEKLSMRNNGQNNMEQVTELRYPGLKHGGEVISLSSGEDTTDNELAKLEIKHQRLVKEKELDILKQKYQMLENCFQELKVKSNEEIERLNDIIKGKEEEYNTELREVLSVFLKAEEVERVIHQTIW